MTAFILVMLFLLSMISSIITREGLISCNASQTDSWKDEKLAAHALGSIDQTLYTNSLEALVFNYSQGIRLFEVDLLLTSDDVLVCRHSWFSDNDIPRLDLGDPVSIWANLTIHSSAWADNLKFKSDERHMLDKSLSFEAFYSLPRDYTSLSFSDLLAFMQIHQDIYIITDTKYLDDAVYMKQFSKIDQEIRHKSVDPAKIIPQVYSFEMYDRLTGLYDFEDYIFSLVKDNWSNQEILNRIKNINISAVALPHSRLDRELIDDLKNQDIGIYVYTVNLSSQAQELFDAGVTGIYTDTLLPADLLIQGAEQLALR